MRARFEFTVPPVNTSYSLESFEVGDEIVECDLDRLDTLFFSTDIILDFNVTFSFNTLQRETPASLNDCVSFTDHWLFYKDLYASLNLDTFGLTFRIALYEGSHKIAEGTVIEWTENREDFEVEFVCSNQSFMSRRYEQLEERISVSSRTYTLSNVQNIKTLKEFDNLFFDKAIKPWFDAWIGKLKYAANVSSNDFGAITQILFESLSGIDKNLRHDLELKTADFDNISRRELVFNVSSLLNRKTGIFSLDSSDEVYFSFDRFINHPEPVAIEGYIKTETKKKNEYDFEPFLDSIVLKRYERHINYCKTCNPCEGHAIWRWVAIDDKLQSKIPTLVAANRFLGRLSLAQEYTIFGYMGEGVATAIRAGHLVCLDSTDYVVKEIEYDTDSSMRAFEAVCFKHNDSFWN